MSKLETYAGSSPPLPPQPARPPRAWKFIGTSLWGLFIFALMFVGQFVAIAYIALRDGGPINSALIKAVSGGGITISLSVMTGLPAVLLAIWVATRFARMRFGDYLALHWTTWRSFTVSLVALVVLVVAWDLLSRALGREVNPGFMVDVLKSAQAENAVWLLIIAFCVAAPITEEFFVRGFLYRGWSESFLRPFGAIILSSMVWTAMHLQYDWFFFGEIMSIGVLLGYVRYRSNSTWLTVVLHGLNNLAATIQTMWLVSHP